jgi:hypothetical protein
VKRSQSSLSGYNRLVFVILLKSLVKEPGK